MLNYKQMDYTGLVFKRSANGTNMRDMLVIL